MYRNGRFCKDYYKTMDEFYCLKCYHPGGYHVEMQDRFSRLVYWIVGKKGCTVGSWCKCDKLIPSDNLRYLEDLSK